MWSGVRCCSIAAVRRSCSCPRTRVCPTNSSRLFGRSAPSNASSASEASTGSVRSRSPLVAHRDRPDCCAGPSRDRVRRSRVGTEAASAADAAAIVSSTASAATRSDQPRPVSAASTLSAAPPVIAARSRGRRRRDELAGERDRDELGGLRADAADLAEHRVVVALHRLGDLCRRERRQHAERRLGTRRR